MTCHIQVGCIEENKLYLHDGEYHAANRCDCNKDITTTGLAVQFKILSEFQTRINHCANGKSDGADAQIKTAEMCDFVFQMNVLGFLICVDKQLLLVVISGLISVIVLPEVLKMLALQRHI